MNASALFRSTSLLWTVVGVLGVVVVQRLDGVHHPRTPCKRFATRILPRVSGSERHLVADCARSWRQRLGGVTA